MIQRMLDGTYNGVQLRHVPMTFSTRIEEVGRFRFKKITNLFRLIKHVLEAQKATGAEVLYYPPASPHLVPVLRDIVFLLAVRRRFKKTIFHFHAGGLAEFIRRFPFPFQSLIRKAYLHPDIVIYVSSLSPKDGHFFEAKEERIIPNAIPDLTLDLSLIQSEKISSRTFRLLYVGALRKSKGVLDLIHATKILRNQGKEVRLTLVGGFTSESFKAEVSSLLFAEQLESEVILTGVLTGTKKLEAFRDSDLFCFPSYYESEAFPVVILEAMCFGLPVVATPWRGIPTQVQEGETGFLVAPNNPEALAQTVSRLLQDRVLRDRLGKNGRKTFEENFSLTLHYQRLNDLFTYVTQ